MGKAVMIDYTNWRGERRVRSVEPRAMVFKESTYHPGEQWILEAVDLEDYGRELVVKDFAMNGIHAWNPETREVEMRGGEKL